MFTTVARTEAVSPSLSVVKSPFGDLLSPQTYYKRRHDALPPSLKGCLSKDAPLAVRVWAFGGEGCLSEREVGAWADGGSIIPRKSSLLLSFPAAHAAPETAVGSQKSSSLVRSPTFSSLGSGAVKFHPFPSCPSACLMRSPVVWNFTAIPAR